MNPVLDIIGALFLLLGAMLCFAASVGLVRFPDVLTRMHAATKPQTLGLLFVVVGVAFSLQNLQALGILLLVVVLQLLTAPVAAHMVGRTAYRTGQVRSDLLTEDDLADDLAAAGFHLVTGDEDAGESNGEDGSERRGRRGRLGGRSRTRPLTPSCARAVRGSTSEDPVPDPPEAERGEHDGEAGEDARLRPLQRPEVAHRVVEELLTQVE